MTDLGAWHGDPELKARIVARMEQHRDADDFIHGLYQRVDPAAPLGYKGCAIGCLLDAQPLGEAYCGCGLGCCTPRPPEPLRPARGWHEEVERQFGIPSRVGCAIDDVFETLDRPGDGWFAVEVLEAIPVGADLSRINLPDLPDDNAAEDLIAAVRNAPVASRPEVAPDVRQ